VAVLLKGETGYLVVVQTQKPLRFLILHILKKGYKAVGIAHRGDPETLVTTAVDAIINDVDGRLNQVGEMLFRGGTAFLEVVLECLSVQEGHVFIFSR
jgi:hypothetical protein